MNEIELIDECKKNILIVEKMTQERLNNYPDYGIYIHAKDQLDLIKTIIANKIFTKENYNKIDIGLMAAKDIDCEEPDYGQAIHTMMGSLNKIFILKSRKYS